MKITLTVLKQNGAHNEPTALASNCAYNISSINLSFMQMVKYYISRSSLPL